MTAASFFWHDYETFGADPQRDRPCQFAGIRTDLDFNIIADPVMSYCQPAEDYLPHPEACLITGITPQLAQEKGVCEAQFSAIVERELAQPGTCGVGYNSIRFDDEVTRNLLYRNFYDPYAREWQNGNSRWDLIDIVRATCALRPQGIEWPLNDEGVPSFRLELLTQANGIGHEAAHDALSDVHATIALARLIKLSQPRLFDYLFQHRQKAAAIDLLKVGSFTPLVHVSGRFPARKHHLAIVLPLCVLPQRSNEVVVYDLSVDPAPLLELDVEAIRQRLFIASDQLPEGVERIALKTVHINKCPVLAPLSVMRPADAERLSVDLDRCQQHLSQIQNSPDLTEKLAEVFQREYAEASSDPDLMIYSGGFFNHSDKAAMQRIRQSKPEQLASLKLGFSDARLAEMLFRYRARNYPQTLSAAEQAQWHEHCVQKLNDSEQAINLQSLVEKIQALRVQLGDEQPILRELAKFTLSKQQQFLSALSSPLAQS
jgi:exodeoxyribonuclease-1